jgi:eukaryotic-like serine/threonine-protein kinase
MSLQPGDRFGPYEVVSKLGQGGMGEVYRAHDTSLNRDVAVKTLPESFAADAERVQRFEREAQVLASLNHPNIAQIYGLEKDEKRGRGSFSEDDREKGPPASFLVMELAEGDDLSDRLAGGGLPFAEALPLAKQIADALEAAHGRGIVHRDLKPANIKVTPDGQVKVLDFGLAKAVDPAVKTGGVSESPTLTARATELGMILGTAAYMAPEQARGKTVDRRADVWAFGAVLFEMLTGDRPFAGGEVTDVLARVIERDPDFEALPADTPASVRRLVKRCLTKDPRRRLQDIGEARILLEDFLAGGGQDELAAGPTPESSSRTFALVPWSVAALLAVLSLYLSTRPTGPTAVGQQISASFALPPDVEFFATTALSLDGSVAAFTGVREGIRQVYVRRLAGFDIEAVPDSSTSGGVALSPDGLHLVIVTNEGLVRMAIDGSSRQVLTSPADFLADVAWGADDVIVFGRDDRLWTVAATGGPAEPLTSTGSDASGIRHRYPAVSTDGQTVFYQSFDDAGPGAIELRAIDRRTGADVVLTDDGSQAVWSSADQVVLARDGSLFVAGLRDGQLVGSPVRVLDDIATSATRRAPASLSASGDLLVATSGVQRGRLVWVSADGAETPVGGPVREYANPRLSPDHRLVLFSSSEGLWTLDIERDSVSRVAAQGQYPVWADATRMVYRDLARVVTRRLDEPGAAEPVAGTIGSDFPASVSPDGSTLAMVRILADTSGDVYVVPLDGSADARPYVATSAYEGGAQFSPDGHWLAYTSDETGRPEVYLDAYPTPGRRVQVSSDGGLHPLWSRDGRRIFYRSGQRMMAVDLTPGDLSTLSRPRLLFERQYTFGPNLSIPHYDLSPDGQGLLLVRQEEEGRSLSFVSNWLAHLEEGR